MSIRTIVGDCLVHFEGCREQTVRGHVVVLVKPDNTVLVHDIDGYQPVAWLTRPESLSVTKEPLWLMASDGDQTLRIEAAGDVALTDHEASAAGTLVGTCRCGGELIRTGRDVGCLDCGEWFGLPNGASMVDSTCECGLPRFRVDRGERFELCLDRACGSMLDAVEATFDREWPCPNCDGDLTVLQRGGLLAGCEHYPDCDTGFSIPDGTVARTCECGLPVFDTPSGLRCLDNTCTRLEAAS